MQRTNMGSIAHGFIERGRIEGRISGRIRGRVEGEARMLIHQLEHRFRPLDPATRERVERATIEHLEAWADRMLDATRIEDVFEQN